MIVRVRVDHIIKSLISNNPDFALWYPCSMAAIVIPQPGWDFLDTMPPGVWVLPIGVPLARWGVPI